MALVKCPECGKDVSTTAKNCPYCGFIPDSPQGPPQWPSPPPAGFTEKEWQQCRLKSRAEEDQKITNIWLAVIVFVVLFVVIALIANFAGCIPEN